MLRALMDKIVSMQKYMDNVSRDYGNSKKELKRNAGDQNNCNRNEECF